jgi:hypothetical protein
MNGEFNPGSLNLMMVFQVNCPGCFIHAFPLMKALHRRYGESITCVALSTAFEDFNLNTKENTLFLFRNGHFVGETLRALEAGQFEWANTTITFPILMDALVSQSELLNPEFIENIIRQQPEWNNASATEKVNLRASLQKYFGQLPQCGFTFASNLMQGTPSFFLFDGSMQILLRWFGHADRRVIEKELDIFIDKKHGKVTV